MTSNEANEVIFREEAERSPRCERREARSSIMRLEFGSARSAHASHPRHPLFLGTPPENGVADVLETQ